MARVLPVYLRPVTIRVLMIVAASVVALTPLLAVSKLTGWLAIEWWAVLIPIASILVAGFVVFTLAVCMWLYTAFRIFGGAPLDPQAEAGEISLDTFFRTAKICFLGHGYVTLLIISFVLMVAKLHHRPDLPIVYPLLPLMTIGALYIFVAVMFKRPEVDVGLSAFIGSVVLSQCITLTVKLDHFGKSDERFPWAVTFIPSWLAYILILVYCGGRATTYLKELLDVRTAGKPISPRVIGDGALRGDDKTMSAASSKIERRLYRKLWLLGALAAWAVGFGASQLMLTLHLDKTSWRSPWFLVVSPGIIGWLLIASFASQPASISTARTARLIFDPFSSYAPPPDTENDVREPEDDAERQPLLPWR